jgi:hypothetical protein
MDACLRILYLVGNLNMGSDVIGSLLPARYMFTLGQACRIAMTIDRLLTGFSRLNAYNDARGSESRVCHISDPILTIP